MYVCPILSWLEDYGYRASKVDGMRRFQVIGKECTVPCRLSRWHKITGITALILVGAACSVLITSAANSQSPIPPNLDVVNRQAKDKPRLDRDSRELADEYVELLTSLRDVAANYERYLRDFNDDVVIQYRPSLDQLRRQLDSMRFAQNEQLLAEQLGKHAEELRRTEIHIRDSKTVYPMRLYRLVQSLRRELTSLDELLQDDILPRLQENETQRKAIQAYVSAVLADARRSSDEQDERRVIIITDSLALTVDIARAKAEARKQAMLEKRREAESRSLGVAVAPPVPRVDVAKPPKLPKLPAPPDGWQYGGRLSGSGLSREFGDTVKSVDSGNPIKIANRYGSIEVVGWGDDVIAATWNVEVQGASRIQERAFMNSAKLTIGHLRTGYVVAPTFTQPTEKSARFIQNELVVYVPARSPISIENTFGEIDASGLEAGVQATTNYAETKLTDIRGGIDATSSMGELTASNCEGPLTLKNSYAPITVEECSGTMTVENAYTQVTVSDSRGPLSIKNSGTVTVSDHHGDLVIENSLGPVEVTGLQGDLTATNRYQSIVVRDIDGSVKLDGAYSTMDLSNVRGNACAVNKFGMIKAEGLSGPLRLSNENGSTTVTLDDLLRGTSRITGSFGSIIVSVPESANLLLLANSTGSISTSLPMLITTKDAGSEGVLKLGRGARDSLFLSAKNGSIIINSDR